VDRRESAKQIDTERSDPRQSRAIADSGCPPMDHSLGFPGLHASKHSELFLAVPQMNQKRDDRPMILGLVDGTFETESKC
jgi:hypothetical protein